MIRQNIISSYSAIKNILYNALYFLNNEELYAHLENIYCEFSDILNKTNEISYDNICHESSTVRLYMNLKYLINYLLFNEIYLPYNIDVYKDKIQIDINKFKKAFNDKNTHHNFKFIYKKFIYKFEYLDKQISKIYSFLKI